MNYDVIIVGGGPGGSTAGALLARAGRRVLLLEKEVFPRFHIGESLLPFGNDVLKRSGAWEKVAAAGFMPKYGAEFMTGNGAVFQRFWFANGLVPGYGQTFQVERARFDDILLRHAADCGCDVRQGVTAKSAQPDRQGVTARFADANDAVTEARARWILDASGRDTFLGRVLELPRIRLDIPKRIAVYAHFSGCYRNDGDAAGHISIIRLKNGWFWLIPLDADRTSVGMVGSLEDLKPFGTDVARWFERAVNESTEVFNRMQRAQRLGPFYTTSDYSYRYKVLAGDRFLLIGDAGGFIDPIFSSGVFIASRSGELAADAVLRADAAGRALSRREQKRHTRRLHRMMHIYQRMIHVYYDDRAFEVFMHPQSRFGVVQSVNSMLAGNTNRNFNMLWRVAVFHLICRLQRRLPIAPRLDFTDPRAQPTDPTRA
jgi:flavin-dependent dehydrogenase